jgi:glycosyltransferase involved in cell wall biosynthesis
LKSTITIVHITPHLGGGVGTSLAQFIDQSKEVGVNNLVFCLDWCQNRIQSLDFGENLTQGQFWKSSSLLNFEILNCDCVLIHYWNHPLLSVFLTDFVSIKNKSIIWCHNSGMAEPHINPNFLTEIANTIVFTSKSSALASNFDFLSRAGGDAPLIVPTVRDLRSFFDIGSTHKVSTLSPKLLYVGSVSKSKMHPDAALIFSQLSLRGFQVRVVGGPDHVELAKEVESLGGKIEISGHIDNVIDFYSESDLFIYPLRADHYGTGEQVILEALASGLPVVAFNNPAEAAILSQFENIKLANSTSEFIDVVLNLTTSPHKLLELSRQVYLSASSLYGSSLMTDELLEIVNCAINSSKGMGKYSKQIGTIDNLLAIYARASFFDLSTFEQILNQPRDGVELILSKIEEGLENSSSIQRWQASSKSTPEHYSKYFPGSKEMGQLAKELRDWRQ